MASSPSGLTELCSGKSGSRSRSPVASESAPGESAFMTGTLAVTAGRGEAGLGRARRGRAAKALFRPVGLAAIPVSYSVGYTRERNMPTVGTNGSLAIRRLLRRGRDHTTLPGFGSPAARHETRRIGKAAGLAAAGSFDGPFGMIAAMIMARANRAAKAKAVAELAPFPKTGLRPHRHRQPQVRVRLGQPERHETPDPVRSGAV